MNQVQEHYNPFDKINGVKEENRRPISVSTRVGNWKVTAHSEEELERNIELVKKYFGKWAFRHDPEAREFSGCHHLRAMPSVNIDDYYNTEVESNV